MSQDVGGKILKDAGKRPPYLVELKRPCALEGEQSSGPGTFLAAVSRSDRKPVPTQEGRASDLPPESWLESRAALDPRESGRQAPWVCKEEAQAGRRRRRELRCE
jgi:hypothetical protein